MVLLLLVVRLLVMLLLLLPTMMATTMLRPRIPARIAIPPLVSRRLLRQRRRRRHPPAGQVDVDATLVLLDGAVEPHLATHVLDGGTDLLDVAGAVVALADDDVQVGLAPRAGVADARAEDGLGLLDVLAVQVDGVAGDAVDRVVLAEDQLRRLLVVGVLLRGVPLAFVGEGFGAGAVAALVGLVGLRVRGESD